MAPLAAWAVDQAESPAYAAEPVLAAALEAAPAAGREAQP